MIALLDVKQGDRGGPPLGDVVQTQSQTHELRFTDTEVRKRFVSWDRGEADREWACLVLLAEHAPGLAPRPLRREVEGGAPVVVMERLAGEPLGGVPLTSAQTASLGRACQDPALVGSAQAAACVWLTTEGALPDPRLTALGIADLDPANVLWDGETCRLVDFEDGGLTDPAFDLADHVERV